MKYDHYVALDWAQSNMAWAHSGRHSEQIETFDVRSDVQGFRRYLEGLKGTKVLTFEETAPAHWLYTELVEVVDKIIVCEPYTNHLLKSGPKTDRVDAVKLLKLLKADMLKPVFHSLDEFVYVRKVVSGHEDLIHALVQLKHRRSALFRSRGMKEAGNLPTHEEQFVLEGIDELINAHEQRRLKYEKELRRIARENLMAKNLMSLPGIGFINAVKTAAAVIDPTRFKHKTGFLLYCGLQKYDVISGGRSYGRRSPRYSRKLKCVFKTAALVCSRNTAGPLRNYYEDLISKKGYPEYQARHALARRIAALALGVMKTGKPLEIK